MKRAVVSACFVFVVAVSALAQRQAPIIWGEPWRLHLGGASMTNGIAMMGDTIILATAHWDAAHAPDGYRPLLAYSFDGGQTVTPRHPIDSVYYEDVRVILVASAGRAYLFRNEYRSADGNTTVMFRSTNAGVNWSVNRPRTSTIWTSYGMASGMEVLTYYLNMTSSICYLQATTNGGDTWQTPMPFYSDTSAPRPLYNALALTRDHLVCMGAPVNGDPWGFMSSTSDRTGQVWSPFQMLPGQPIAGSGDWHAMMGDTSSETAVFIYNNSVGTWSRNLYMQRTSDAGQSWSLPRNLAGGALLDYTCKPRPFCRGKLWGMCWQNYWDSDSTRRGVYLSFSANHGKDWYPPSRIGIDCPEMDYSTGEFIGNEVRLCWAGVFDSSTVYVGDNMLATGELTPDTLRPIVTLNLVAPDTIRAGDSVRFDLSATDNDTLSELRLLVADSSGELLHEVWSGAEGYSQAAAIVIPHEGLYRYKVEAVDYWENVGTLPDTGWQTFHTEGWSTADPFIIHRSSFIVSTYPNPSNGWPTVQLSPDWLLHGPVRLKVFNILGQKLYDDFVAAPRIDLRRISSTATGLFLIDVTAPGHHICHKILVLR
jgi:hypothetical protein